MALTPGKDSKVKFTSKKLIYSKKPRPQQSQPKTTQKFNPKSRNLVSAYQRLTTPYTYSKYTNLQIDTLGPQSGLKLDMHQREQAGVLERRGTDHRVVKGKNVLNSVQKEIYDQMLMSGQYDDLFMGQRVLGGGGGGLGKALRKKKRAQTSHGGRRKLKLLPAMHQRASPKSPKKHTQFGHKHIQSILKSSKRLMDLSPSPTKNPPIFSLKKPLNAR